MAEYFLGVLTFLLLACFALFIVTFTWFVWSEIKDNKRKPVTVVKYIEKPRPEKNKSSTCEWCRYSGWHESEMVYMGGEKICMDCRQCV